MTVVYIVLSDRRSYRIRGEAMNKLLLALFPLLVSAQGPLSGGAVDAGSSVASILSPVSVLTSSTCAFKQTGLGGTVSCTWSTPPPAGSNLVCGGDTWNSGSAVTGLSISDGTAFTPAIAARDYSGGNNHWIIVAYRFSIPVTAPATVTMTIAGTDQFADIVCNAFLDSSGTPSVDGTCTFGTASAAGATVQCSSAIVTTGNDIVIAQVAASGTFPTLTTGWSPGSNVQGTVTGYMVLGSPASINPLFNVQTGQFAGIDAVAFKP